MPIQCDRYAVRFYREDGTEIRQTALEVDWEPAREQLAWDALRADASAALLHEPLVVEPIWDEKVGEPVVRGFRMRAAGDERIVERDFPAAYFKEQVRQTSARLVKSGELKDGEVFRYQVCAYRQPTTPDAARLSVRQGDAVASSPAGFHVEEVSCPPPIDTRTMEMFLDAAYPHGPTEQDDFPVFIPQPVLDEITVSTVEAGAVESGGVLLGYLHRDPDRAGVVFVEVTAQVPAAHTRAEATKLTFTAETWAAADAAIRLRGRSELMVGWHHSHPQKFWCRDCAPERRAVCPLQQGAFFSTSDCAVHRTAFPQAYSPALLANHTEQGVEYALFGWRLGVIAPRGFYVLGAARADVSAPVVQEEVVHAPTCTR